MRARIPRKSACRNVQVLFVPVPYYAACTAVRMVKLGYSFGCNASEFWNDSSAFSSLILCAIAALGCQLAKHYQYGTVQAARVLVVAVNYPD